MRPARGRKRWRTSGQSAIQSTRESREPQHAKRYQKIPVTWKAAQQAVRRSRAPAHADRRCRTVARRNRHAEVPASTAMACPVIAAARSETRKAPGWRRRRPTCRAAGTREPQRRCTTTSGRAGGHVGRRRNRQHGVDADTALARFARQRPRHAEERRLRRRIGRLPRHAGDGGQGRDVDNAAAPAVHHLRQHRPAAAKEPSRLTSMTVVPVAIGRHGEQRLAPHRRRC